MNKVRLGYHRDKRIVRELEEHKVLNTYQIALLIFEGKSALRKAQQRLKKLVQDRKIKRIRLALDEPYIYYLQSATGRFKHLLAVNWVYVWVIKNLCSWQQLWCWEYEPNYKGIRPDAFYGIRNVATGEIKFYFVELDRSHNLWDKTIKYNTFYQSGNYAELSWAKQAKVFPTILVITTDLGRLKTIQKSVEKENRHKLHFQVMLLDDVVNPLVSMLFENK